MPHIFYKMKRCVAFRRISHPELPWITIRFPLILTALGIVTFSTLPARPVLFGAEGLNSHIISLVATLPGFFVAALAAVSTFHRTTLDHTMPEPAPTLLLRSRGHDDPVKLTTRMFLSHLFSYLTSYSFFLAISCVAAEGLAPSVKAMMTSTQPYNEEISFLAKLGYVAFVGWFISNIITAAMYGMYFLAERMHRPSS